MGNSSGTKFSRCNPESAFKGFQKIFVFAETRHFGNFACAVTRLFQQLGGMAQTQFYNVGNYGYAFVLFEDFAKVGVRDMHAIRKILHGEFLGKIVQLDKPFGFFNIVRMIKKDSFIVFGRNGGQQKKKSA